MQSSHSDYTVTLQTHYPNFAAERRYVLTERDYAKRQLAKVSGRRLIFFSYPSLGLFRPRDWERYIQALDKYDRELARHEREIQKGLIPLKIMVANRGERADGDIKVRVVVENGHINEKKKPPKRPDRLDGPPNSSDKPHFPALGGFSRRGIHISAHRIEAEFSRLEAGDGADLVRKVLYVDSDARTRFSYAIDSREYKGVKGRTQLR